MLDYHPLWIHVYTLKLAQVQRGNVSQCILYKMCEFSQTSWQTINHNMRKYDCKIKILFIAILKLVYF